MLQRLQEQVQEEWSSILKGSLLLLTLLRVDFSFQNQTKIANTHKDSSLTYMFMLLLATREKHRNIIYYRVVAEEE